MAFTVGQLAKLSGVSIRSLHHYDEIGLLCPSERSEAGYRLYSEQDVERLNQIQGLRWLELPLEGVKDVLDSGGGAIPEVVDEKIAELTRQIETATELRARLENLRTQILRGQISGAKQLISAVELYKHYEKHLSADELNRFSLMSAADAVEWRKAYDDVASAIKRTVSPESDEGQEIAYRWGVLSYKRSNGDLSLAIKAKAAWENDAGVRRSMSALTGTDPAVMQFVLAASDYAHRQTLARYFSAEEVSRLNIANQFGLEWLRVATDLRTKCANRLPAESSEAQSLVDRWFKQIDVVTGGDRQLREKFLGALRRDEGLKKRWLATDELLDFARQVEQLKNHVDQ